LEFPTPPPILHNYELTLGSSVSEHLSLEPDTYTQHACLLPDACLSYALSTCTCTNLTACPPGNL
jgi:hypothetical protein